MPWNGDGDFSWERFDERYTADLANNVGNLVNRVLSMIERYRGGAVPQAERTSLDSAVASAVVRYRAAMDDNLLHHGAAAVLDLSSAANGFIEERAPWTQAKDPARAKDLDDTLGSLARGLIAVATLLSPFVPVKTQEIAKRFGLPALPQLDEVVTVDLSGKKVERGNVLFPRPRD